MGGSNLSTRGDFSLVAPVNPRTQSDGLAVVLWRQRWIVILTLFVFLAAGLAYSLLAPKKYTSNGSFAINPERNDNAEMVNRVLATEQKIIYSAQVLVPVSIDANVNTAKVFDNVKNRLAFLKKELRVDVSKHDNTVTVSFDAAKPEDAQAVVQSVLTAYQSYREQQTLVTSNPDVDKDRKAKNEDVAMLKKSADEMHAFRLANPDIDFNGSFTAIQNEKIRSLGITLTAAERETMDARGDYDESMKSIKDDADKLKSVNELAEKATPSSADVVAGLKKERSTIDQQVQDLERQHLRPTHPQVVALQHKIDDLNLRFAVASKKRLDVAQARETALRTESENAVKHQREVETKTNNFSYMQENANHLREEIARLDDRILNAKVPRDPGARPVVVLEMGSLPEKPTWPYMPEIMAIALVAGTITGMGFARVREWTAPRMQSVDEVRNALGLPILACIPHWIEQGANPLDPMGDVAEEYSDLRETIITATAERGAKNLLMTAPSHEHGVSVIICNLGKAMAKAGDRVLIVDANFRSPAQHALFDLHPEIGASSVLAGDNKAEEAIRNTGLRGLDLLPCGPIPKRPSELLKSAAFEDLLRDMGTQYDWVLVDSPPATVAPDARIAAASCDATVLVIRAQKGDRRLAEHAYDALQSVGAQVIGVVINDVPRRSSWEGSQSYVRAPRELPDTTRSLPVTSSRLD